MEIYEKRCLWIALREEGGDDEALWQPCFKLFKAAGVSLSKARVSGNCDKSSGALSETALSETVWVDWNDVMSIENALTGVNWVILWLPSRSMNWGQDESLQRMWLLIQSVIKISGSSLRLVLVIEAKASQGQVVDQLLWLQELSYDVRRLVLMSGFYRSQGLPTAVFSIPGDDELVPWQRLLSLFSSREKFPTLS